MDGLSKTLIFIDLEYVTTKYRENGHREYLQEIIEFAMIIKKNNQIIKYSKMIKPRLYFNHIKTSQTFNKFSKEELQTGVDLKIALRELDYYYYPSKSIVIFWGGNDVHCINLLCEKYNLNYKFLKEDTIDLSQKFKKFYKFNQAITLSKALEFLNISSEYDKHRALPDTEMLFKIFNKMKQDGFDDNFLYIKK